MCNKLFLNNNVDRFAGVTNVGIFSHIRQQSIAHLEYGRRNKAIDDNK